MQLLWQSNSPRCYNKVWGQVECMANKECNHYGTSNLPHCFNKVWGQVECILHSSTSQPCPNGSCCAARRFMFCLSAPHAHTGRAATVCGSPCHSQSDSPVLHVFKISSCCTTVDKRLLNIYAGKIHEITEEEASNRAMGVPEMSFHDTLCAIAAPQAPYAWSQGKDSTPAAVLQCCQACRAQKGKQTGCHTPCTHRHTSWLSTLWLGKKRWQQRGSDHSHNTQAIKH